MKSSSKTQKLAVRWKDRRWSAAIAERVLETNPPADRVAIYSTDNKLPKSETQLIVRNRLTGGRGPYQLRPTWKN